MNKLVEATIRDLVDLGGRITPNVPAVTIISHVAAGMDDNTSILGASVIRRHFGVITPAVMDELMFAIDDEAEMDCVNCD